MHQAGRKIWTEHEINRGRAPVREVKKKRPDGLYRAEHGLVWVEVENAWKNRERREAIAKFAEENLSTNSLTAKELANGEYLDAVEIVSTNEAATAAMKRTLESARTKEELNEAQAYSCRIVEVRLNACLNRCE
jgi:hypothetical protein